MYEYFNPNPQGKSVGDCVVRAISKIMDQKWKDVLLSLFTYAYNMADMPSSNAVWGAYLKSKGFYKTAIPNKCPDCYTVRDFCRDHPHGDFILSTGTHTIAVRNGTYYDSWDSGSEVPIFFFRR